MFDRLLQTLLAAGIDADHISGTPPSVTIHYKPQADQADFDAGAELLAGFDWSQSAHDLWLLLRRRTAETEQIDQQIILRAIVQVLLDELNLFRAQIIGQATQTWDPANMANGSGVTSPNITITGAAFGDSVDVLAPYTLAGVAATGYVSAANTVNIRLHNSTGGAVNLASGNWSVVVRRHLGLQPRTLTQARNAIKAAIEAGQVDQ